MPTFTLPTPPSTNGLFRNVPGHGRVKTAKYKAWLTAAGWELRAQRIPRTPGRVAIVLVMKRPSANADIDNRIKAVCDLLVNMQIIDDDKNVMSITAAWGNVEGCVCTVKEVNNA